MLIAEFGPDSVGAQYSTGRAAMADRFAEDFC
jgi:hypothetical protein